MKYKITKDHIQLNQLIKILRISHSGGQAKMMITDGIVKVNGKIDLRVRAKLFAGDKVEIFDNIIELE